MKTYCKIAQHNERQLNVDNLTDCPCDNPCGIVQPEPMEHWDQDDLVALFMHLPQYTEILELRYVKCKSAKQISEILKLPMSTVYDRLIAATAKAKEFFLRRTKVTKYVNEVWRKKV